MDLEGKWKAIVIGGLITGLAPFIPLVNLACCLIPMVGAIVAVAVYRSTVPPPPVSHSDGIVLGAMSGVVGTAIYGVLIIPLVVFIGGTIGGFVTRLLPDIADMPSNVRALLQGIFDNLGNVVGLIVFIKVLAHLALSLVFGMLGGLLAVALFKRNPSS